MSKSGSEGGGIDPNIVLSIVNEAKEEFEDKL
jgi:hypothetical protein